MSNDSIGAVHSGQFPDTAHQFSTVPQTGKGIHVDSVYKVIELVGTSSESWEKAAKNAIDVAAKSLHDLRIAEVVKQDLMIEDDKVVSYRTKVRLSFKYHTED
jgi:flavin-binding protein dodecin